jgi:hypothetical protein
MCYSFQIFASVELISLLPNPAWDDALGEYIEIRNTGCADIDVTRYTLSDLSGKTYILPSYILKIKENKRFLYSETKIALNNSWDESVFLRDTSGNTIDSYSYSGTQKDNIVLNIGYNDTDCALLAREEITTGNISSWSNSGSGEEKTTTGETLIHIGSTIETGSIIEAETDTPMIQSGTIDTASWSEILIDTHSGSILWETGTTDMSSSELHTFSGAIYATGTELDTSTGVISMETGSLTPTDMWYSDKDGDSKIDTLEITYPYSLTGIVNTGAIFLFSRSGGLSQAKIDTVTGYIREASLSGNMLILLIEEWDIEKILLKINNTTTSDLRLKSSGNLWFTSISGQKPEDFLLTKSFDEYRKVFPRSVTQDLWGNLATSSGSSETITSDILSGAIDDIRNRETEILSSSWGPSPLIFPTLQYPTNASFSGNVFRCEWLDSCRVNLTYEPIFTWGFLEKNYICETRIWESYFSSCNPNTLYFLTGDLIELTLIEKSTWQKTIKNWVVDVVRKDTMNSVQELPSSDIASWSTLTGAIIFPEIIPILQSPTNATLSGEIFTCNDRECRINLTLEPLFSSGISMGNFLCSFGTGGLLTVDTHCNPNTYYFSASGNLDVAIKSKINPTEKISKSYQIIYLPGPMIVVWSPKNAENISMIDTGKPMAILDFDGKEKEYYEKIWDHEMNCHTLTCSINWTAQRSYDPEGSSIRFLWIYGPNEISTSRDPGTRKYPLWDHRMILRVIDIAGNYTEIVYTIHVLGPKTKEEKIKIKKQKVEKISRISVTQSPVKKVKKIRMMFFSSPEIILQGKTGEKVSDTEYLCRYKRTPKCSFNLTLTGGTTGYTYKWLLDGKEVHIGKNPTAWKLSSWKHVITLLSYTKDGTTPLDKKEISVKVLAEPKKIKAKKSSKPKRKSTPKISLIPEVSANSIQSDDFSPWSQTLAFLLFSSGIWLGYIMRKKNRQIVEKR